MNEAKQEWNQAVQQIKQPGKMHRALRIGIAQLPVHRVTRPMIALIGFALTLLFNELERFIIPWKVN